MFDSIHNMVDIWLCRKVVYRIRGREQYKKKLPEQEQRNQITTPTSVLAKIKEKKGKKKKTLLGLIDWLSGVMTRPSVFRVPMAERGSRFESCLAPGPAVKHPNVNAMFQLFGIPKKFFVSYYYYYFLFLRFANINLNWPFEEINDRK